MTFQTLSVPVHGCRVLMSTDWLIVSVPPGFGAAAAAANARSMPDQPDAFPAASPTAAPAAVRPVRRRSSRRVIDGRFEEDERAMRIPPGNESRCLQGFAARPCDPAAVGPSSLR